MRLCFAFRKPGSRPVVKNIVRHHHNLYKRSSLHVQILSCCKNVRVFASAAKISAKPVISLNFANKEGRVFAGEYLRGVAIFPKTPLGFY
jgi:hypothetical protein